MKLARVIYCINEGYLNEKPGYSILAVKYQCDEDVSKYTRLSYFEI